MKDRNKIVDIDIEEILGSILHDSIGALGAIEQATKTGTKTLREQPELLWTQRMQKFFDTITEQQKFVFGVLFDLKKWMEAEEIKPSEFKPTDLESLVGAVLKTIAIPKEIVITVEIPKKFQLMIEPFAMKEVLINLINNSIEAILRSGEIEIRVHEKNEKVCIEIQDSGIGMPKEILSKLFKRRFSTKSLGTGLGLLICDSIVKAHRGFIFAESQKGNGTTFTVVLPKTS